MDYFYAQVEELKDPSLKKLPVGIGSPDGRGVLCTSNYEARKYGVKSAMPTKIALGKCPHLKLVKPCFEDYKNISAKVFEIFYEYTDLVEGISLDEAYLDVSECTEFDNSAFMIARDIRQRVLKETGLTCSAGISFNKFFAKFACEHNKPNGQFLIPPNVSSEFIHNIDVDKISGVGKVFKETLANDNIYKLKDLICFERYELQERYGKFGTKLYDYARGVDLREVSAHRVRKSLSVENTFFEDISSHDELSDKIHDLHDEFLRRLDKHKDKVVSTIFVKIKYHDFLSTTIERQFKDLSLESFTEIFIERFTQRVEAVRLLGVGVKFKSAGSTLQLPLPFYEV